MLTREEISTKVIPLHIANQKSSISSLNSSSNPNNLILKSSFKGKPLNIFLPISNKSLIHIHSHSKLSQNNKTNVTTLHKTNLHLPEITTNKHEYRTLVSSNETTQKHIDAFSNISNKLKYTLHNENNDTNSNIKRRKQNHMKFNLKRLMRKVQSIIRDNKHYSRNYNQIEEYKNKMLSFKKSTRTLNELYIGKEGTHQLSL